MATDATGAVTTPDNIPTYNTAADAPSGKGLNAIVAALQAALVKRPSSDIAALAANDVPVWNGAAWVRPSGAADATKFLRGDGAWAAPVGPVTFRKTAQVVVANTVAETDLLGGTITIPGNTIGVNGFVRVTIHGDWTNNSGVAQAPPRFRFKLGGVALLDTFALGAVMSTAPNRWGWRADILLQNQGSAVAQFTTMHIVGQMTDGVSAAAVGSIGGLTVAYLTAGGFANYDSIAAAGVAVDTTAAKLVEFSVINGVANAAYDTTLKGALVEVV